MSRQEQRIVVGVDGSDSSKAALRWAIRQAKLTGSLVDVLTAWHHPPPCGCAAVADGGDSPEGKAKEALTEALAEVSGLGQPGTWRTRIGDDGVRQPAMRPACPLPSPGPARRTRKSAGIRVARSPG